LEHLPERDRPLVKRRLRRAWAETDYERALDRLQVLAGELERSHPGAVGSLREGLSGNVDSECLTGVLVDHVQEFENATVCRRVVLEVERPDVVWALSPQSGGRTC
jgi:hypothetical protein